MGGSVSLAAEMAALDANDIVAAKGGRLAVNGIVAEGAPTCSLGTAEVPAWLVRLLMTANLYGKMNVLDSGQPVIQLNGGVGPEEWRQLSHDVLATRYDAAEVQGLGVIYRNNAGALRVWFRRRSKHLERLTEHDVKEGYVYPCFIDPARGQGVVIPVIGRGVAVSRAALALLRAPAKVIEAVSDASP